MTSNHKSENHKPNGPHDLGQISKKSPGYGPDYAVVEFAGTDNEAVITTFFTSHDAYRFIERHYNDDECGVDVMLILDDGTLTTEF